MMWYIILLMAPSSLAAFTVEKSCNKDQRSCRDGTCIPFHAVCDGVVDCKDWSDETHARCRNQKCQKNWFRCAYGACVDGNAPCNNVQDCADNSDELLPRCRNESMHVRGKFKCQDGSTIPAHEHCDGARDCPDGSDETLRACAGQTCPSYLFQCAYGACVDGNSNCSKTPECADNSDEAPELCGGDTTLARPPDKLCRFPEYPDNGIYTTDIVEAKPGHIAHIFRLYIRCNQGYGSTSTSSKIFCTKGDWSEPMPECKRTCRLNLSHPAVEYTCNLAEKRNGDRSCLRTVLSGTRVKPSCRLNYYSVEILPDMQCIDGRWANEPTCYAECGTVTPSGHPYVAGGVKSLKGDIPWHAGVYSKAFSPYKQICGGSIVRNDIVISAAHCFWDSFSKVIISPTMFAVSVGNVFRSWNESYEWSHGERPQFSDVHAIHTPRRFIGNEGRYEQDIAVVIVKTPFVYRSYIRPVCMAFRNDIQKNQLAPMNYGKVAGWGLTGHNGKSALSLQVIDYPVVDYDTCSKNVPMQFKAYITGDKICAGFLKAGKSLCEGDSGGGLTFPSEIHGTTRYFLQGIVSTAPNPDIPCNTDSYTTFTLLKKYEEFIREFW